MKTHIKNPFTCLGVAPRFLPALLAGLGLLLAGRVPAQTFTVIYQFTGAVYNLAASAGLTLSNNTLYGTTQGYGVNGSVFKVNTDGNGFTNLYRFTASSGAYSTNNDGARPLAGLIISGNTLYGTAEQGGPSGAGTVFKVNTDGTDFTNLHGFSGPLFGNSTNNDGNFPYATLIMSSNTLYGTAVAGGSLGNGTVFAVNIDGTGFTNLHNFIGSDGLAPAAKLILSGNFLYGTAQYGGSGAGTVFKVSTDGTGFTNLHNFSAILNVPPYTNDDGGFPVAELILSGSTLYGTARSGGSSGNGTIFAINTDGTGFTNLHTFTVISASYPNTNSDGAGPGAALVLLGGTLYGTTGRGGSWGGGTLFAINTDGTGFTSLHNLDPYSGASQPYAGLILSGDTLYGTASSVPGTVFSLSFAPQLAIIPSGTNVILTWPTNVAGFDYTGYTLQSTTNLAPPAVWTAVSPGPVVLNGQNTVTNPISGAQQFYRVSQSAIPPGMALIPAGSFIMGNSIGDNDIFDAGLIAVTVSAFYMDVNPVSYSQWQSVYNWATNHGYGFYIAGSGKALNHPVQSVSWFDSVKWSNARSQQAGLTPVYYSDAGLTQIYTNGVTTNVSANWIANGYRLPTEAEWEKAARGGVNWQRFPWGDTITESQANYNSYYPNGTPYFSYNLNAYSGFNTNYDTGGYPYTSPVGSFAANGYRLKDMAGNVSGWCWDLYEGRPYPTGSPYLGGTDPHGPASPSPNGGSTYGNRILRGGSWDELADEERCAFRGFNDPRNPDFTVGFRCVKGL